MITCGDFRAMKLTDHAWEITSPRLPDWRVVIDATESEATGALYGLQDAFRGTWDEEAGSVAAPASSAR